MPGHTSSSLARILAAILLGALPCAAWAEEGEEAAQPIHLHLVNLDTPVLAPPGTTVFHGDARVFGAEEDMVYGTLEVARGIRENLTALLRAGMSNTTTFAGPGFDIRHGGTDVEIVGRWRPRTEQFWAAEAGVSWANTPAQRDVFVTAQLLGQHRVGSALTLYFVPKAVFVRDNPIVGIGGGLSVRLGESVEAVADVTGIVSGNNTRSVITGEKVRSEVWGAALRWRPRDATTDWTFDVGVTNGTGGTTGFSLTPGLSGSTAIYLGVTIHR